MNGEGLDISNIVNQLTPLVTSIMNLAIMFFMMKFLFSMMERVMARA